MTPDTKTNAPATSTLVLGQQSGRGSEFKDKVVVVTGGVSNLGGAISRAFARAGAKLSINYFSNSEGAEALRRKLEAEGTPHVFTPGDICEESTITCLCEHTMEEFGRIDILINNSGIHQDRVAWKLSSDEWASVLGVDLTAPFLCIKSILPHMREGGYGRILNIGSVVASTGVAGAANYAAAKAGLEGLTRAVSLEVARWNVTVNTLALGYINIGMGTRLPDKIRDAVLAKIPVGRFGSVNEVLHAVFSLTSENAGYITGQTIHMSGGMYMGG